jgi:Protein of unknown function (DUF1351).
MPVRVTSKVGTIDDNLGAVEEFIKERCAEYETMVFSEDTVKDGKKFLADIRKEKKTIDEERKAIKKAWMEPYTLFEKRVKGIIALYDRPERLISDQIAEYENQRKELKKQDIRQEYGHVVSGLDMPELAEWLPPSRIYDARWENATCSKKKVREEIQSIFRQLEMSVETIRSMKSEWEVDALEVLRKTGNLQEAIGKITSLNEQKKRIEEMQREAEEKKRQDEERRQQEREKRQMEDAADAEADGSVSQQEQDAPAHEGVENAPFAMERTVTLHVKIGENSLGILTDFLDENNMEYEVM